jgi:hypothetical protein
MPATAADDRGGEFLAWGGPGRARIVGPGYRHPSGRTGIGTAAKRGADLVDDHDPKMLLSHYTLLPLEPGRTAMPIMALNGGIGLAGRGSQ